jgi:excinuclease ABC subunit A
VLRHRRLRLGQVDAGQRGSLQGRRQQAAQARQRPGAHRAITGLEQLDKIISVDQSPIGRTPRSNPATYIGLFDQIRELFSNDPGGTGARLQAGALLVQRQGRALRGLQGRRADQDRDALPSRRLRAVRAVPRQALQPETLEVRFKGKTIADVLEMPIGEALEFFAHIPKIQRRVQALNDVGLIHAARAAGDDAVRR